MIKIARVVLLGVLLTAMTILMPIAGVTKYGLADAKTQSVALSPSTTDQSPGSSFTLSVMYNVSDGDSTLTGLGIRFHFDSTKLQFSDFSNLFPDDLICAESEPQDDSQDFDNDASTNKYVSIAWLSFSGNWPNQSLPFQLVQLDFSVHSGTAQSTTYVNVTFSSTAAGYEGSGSATNVMITNGTGIRVTSDLWIRAVIDSQEKGPIEAVWKKGGEDTTSRGDWVIWGHFYASPDDVTWGSENNPDLFVKIWFDVSGRVDVNYFHVSVPDIEVYSDYAYDGTPDEQGTTTMSRRYIRQYYENGQSYSEENYEDGNPPAGYWPTGDPSGYYTINTLRIGSIINTVEKGPIHAIWRLGGDDTTSRGDQVLWGHFYASPSDVTWGSENNPDLFVKIWFDVSGRVDVNFFHVSVPDIEVHSDLPSDGTYDQQGTTTMDNRYIRHEYWR